MFEVGLPLEYRTGKAEGGEALLVWAAESLEVDWNDDGDVMIQYGQRATGLCLVEPVTDWPVELQGTELPGR